MHTAARVLLWTLGILVLLVLLAALALRVFDWNLVKDEIAAQLGERLGTDVAIRGDVDVGFESGALRVQAGGVRVADAFDSPQPLLALEHVSAALALRPLLRGEIVFDRIVLERPRLSLIHSGDGDFNWELEAPADAERPEAPGPVLPAVRHLEVRDARVVYRDRLLDETIRASLARLEGRLLPEDVARMSGVGKIAGRDLALDAEARYLERPGDWRVAADLAVADARLSVNGVPTNGGVDVELNVPEPAQLEFLPLPDALRGLDGLRLAGHIERRDGRWQGDDLRLVVGEHQVRGDVRVAPDGRLEAQAAGAGVELSVSGSVDEPDLRIEARVPEPAQLDLLQLPELPAAGAAALTVRLTQDQGHWLLDDLELVLGEQRITGEVRVDPDREPTMIYATLHLNELPLPEPEVDEARDQLIPPVELPTAALRLVDLRADLSVGRITDAPIPINDIEVRVELEDGRLVLRPAALDVSGGELEGRIEYDASRSFPSATARLALRGLDLAPLAPDDGESPVTGELSGTVDLHSRGRTLDELAANLDGQLLFVMREGAVSAAWVEALDLDLGEWVVATAAPGTVKTPVRCALIALDAQKGALSAEPVVIDTRDSVITVEGQIGLGTEQLKLTLQAYPKDASLLSIESRIRIEGTLIEPSIDMLAAETAGQGAIALALGALAGPLAALVPFLDPGLAEDQNCGRLLGEEPRAPPQGTQ